MIDITFETVVQKSPNRGGWTYVIWPKSAEYFGTHGAVKVRGTVDSEPFQSCFMAMGDGNHMLPVKGSILKDIDKSVGDSVSVHLQERL